MISRTWVLFALVGALAGCDPAAGVTQRAADRPAITREASASATAPVASTRPRRGRLLAGERVERAPVWPPADSLAPLRERLPASLREQVDRSSVPVLVPDDPEWLARARMHAPPGPHGFGYALSTTNGERSMSVHASRVATLLPHVGRTRGNRRIRGGEGFYSVNDGIRTASWIEHGVAYGLDLECRDPDSDGCSEDALAALVEGLAYVGGVGGAP